MEIVVDLSEMGERLKLNTAGRRRARQQRFAEASGRKQQVAASTCEEDSRMRTDQISPMVRRLRVQQGAS